MVSFEDDEENGAGTSNCGEFDVCRRRLTCHAESGSDNDVDELMEDANDGDGDGDGDADMHADEDEGEGDNDDDEGENENDEDDDQDEAESQHTPSRSRPTSRPPTSLPNGTLANGDSTITAANSRTTLSFRPQVRQEALTAPVYDIVPTIAAPQGTSINTVTATPDMRLVFSGGSDGYIRKFNWPDTANGKLMLTVAQRHPFVDSVTKAGVLLSYWENEDTTGMHLTCD